MTAKSSIISNWLVMNESKVEASAMYKDIKTKRKTSLKKAMSIKKSFKSRKHLEEKELTSSPIAGTYIIKEWNVDIKGNQKDNTKKHSSSSHRFSKNEVALNSIAASFVEITPQAKAKLERIPNRIGPYECKLCKVIYKDAFELAMHNCPRVVHLEYKCTECDKTFNCPANLASHKRWHRPKSNFNKKTTNERGIDEHQALSRNESQSSSKSSWDQFAMQPNQHQHHQSSLNQMTHDMTSEWLNQFYSSYFAAAAAAALSNSNGLHHQQHYFNNTSLPLMNLNHSNLQVSNFLNNGLASSTFSNIKNY